MFTLLNGEGCFGASGRGGIEFAAATGTGSLLEPLKGPMVLGGARDDEDEEDPAAVMGLTGDTLGNGTVDLEVLAL
jgi:hypothetical protein